MVASTTSIKFSIQGNIVDLKVEEKYTREGVWKFSPYMKAGPYEMGTDDGPMDRLRASGSEKEEGWRVLVVENATMHCR